MSHADVATSTSSTTSSSRPSRSPRSPKLVPGGGRRHVSAKRAPAGLTGDTHSDLVPEKVYTPQQLRLLFAPAAEGPFIPGGGRRHHTKSAPVSPKAKAKKDKKGKGKSPASSLYSSASAVLPHQHPTQNHAMFGAPLAGVRPPRSTVSTRCWLTCFLSVQCSLFDDSS